MLRFHANSVISDRDFAASIGRSCGDVYARRLVAVILDAVADQVLKQLRQLGAIAANDQQIVARYLGA
ncbi:hypothetical protein OAS39_03160 [Pirellulales bacterium]|nr:hypothetical protein [Pirellulales bacterium]